MNNPLACRHNQAGTAPPPLADRRSLSPAIELEAWHRLLVYSGQHDEESRDTVQAKNLDAPFSQRYFSNAGATVPGMLFANAILEGGT